MITIIQTDSNDRFDIALEEDRMTIFTNGEPIIEGYVQKGDDGLWHAFRREGFNNVEVGVPNKNPVEVGKAVINDYDRRCARMIERTIAQMEKSIAEMPEGILKNARMRLRDGTVAKLAAGDF